MCTHSSRAITLQELHGEAPNILSATQVLFSTPWDYLKLSNNPCTMSLYFVGYVSCVYWFVMRLFLENEHQLNKGYILTNGEIMLYRYQVKKNKHGEKETQRFLHTSYSAVWLVIL